MGAWYKIKYQLALHVRSGHLSFFHSISDLKISILILQYFFAIEKNKLISCTNTTRVVVHISFSPCLVNCEKPTNISDSRRQILVCNLLPPDITHRATDCYSLPWDRARNEQWVFIHVGTHWVERDECACHDVAEDTRRLIQAEQKQRSLLGEHRVWIHQYFDLRSTSLLFQGRDTLIVPMSWYLKRCCGWKGEENTRWNVTRDRFSIVYTG